MSKKSSDTEEHTFRLALYGVRSSGKTCILSALALPRIPHPDDLSCSWIENVPGHPLPSGDPDSWVTEDPFHVGWKWLHEQRNRLRSGELPPPNPNREDVMRFLFAFGAPTQGTRRVELLDYSGEMVTASASELAARLRHHMRSCDGLMVLAEVPYPGQDHAPLAEDLEKLKGAFLLLLNERAAGPQPEWPIAILFNKWDRRVDASQHECGSRTELIDAFLNQGQKPPHASLVQTLRNAVGEDNIQSFPVSAFGAHRIRSDGAEVPLLDGALLRSHRLEDGFVWVMERCDLLQVERTEQAASAASWYAFWQVPFGRSDATDDDHPSLGGRWLRGVSPWAGICAGWRLRHRFPSKSDLHGRTARALRTFGLKFASQIAVFVVLLLSLVSVIRTAADGVRYRTVLATKADSSATAAQLQSAEDWLDEYFKGPGYPRWLSHQIVLDRADAATLLVELRTARDDKLWQAVQTADSPQARLSLVRKYSEAFPTQGLRSHEAMSLVAEVEQKDNLAANRAYLNDLTLKIEALRVEAAEDLNLVHGLSEGISDVPHPNVSSAELETQQQSLRGQLAEKQRQISDLARQAAWERFRQTYVSQMHNKNVRDAARELASRTPKDVGLQDLIDDFVKRAPIIIQEKIRDALKDRSWQLARDTSELCNDPNLQALLSAVEIKELRKLRAMVDEGQDSELYSQIIRNKPQCADQLSAYLSRAPLRTMKSETEEYQRWLSKLSGPLDLTLSLTGIQWHADFWAWRVNYYNDVTVQVRGNPCIAATQVSSKPNTRSADLGNATLQAGLNETITIDVTVVTKHGWVITGSMSGGSGSWTGTPSQLRSGVTIDLAGDGFTNKATFSITGIPTEPDLPAWTRR